jgi:ATP-dependent RNA helicase DeaD
MALITSKDLGKIRQLEKTIGKKFTAAEVPTGFDVCEKQLFSLVHRVHNVEVNESQIEQYLPRIYAEFNDMSKEEVIKRFASLEFNQFLEYYKKAPDLNAKADESARSERGMRSSSTTHTRLFINLGSVDDFTRGDMLGYICNTANIKGDKVGRIDIKGVYSFFEVENDVLEQVQSGFRNADYSGRNVRIEISQDGDRRDRDGGGRRSGGGERKSYGGGGRSGGGERKSYGGGGGRSYGGGGKSYGDKDRSSRGGGDRDRSAGNSRSGSSRSAGASSDRAPRKRKDDSGKGGRW